MLALKNATPCHGMLFRKDLQLYLQKTKVYFLTLKFYLFNFCY